MNILNRKGFNFIEVIIGVVIISLIVISFSQLFSFSLDLPYISQRSKALYYATKEMEKLNNSEYSNISSISKTPYPDDLDFDYEILVSENATQNKKDVWINFYEHGKTKKLVELYSKFIKLERLKICDDFQDGNDSYPPWNWSPNPSGRWSIVQFPANSGNYRYRYARRQGGYSYPDWSGSSNYSLSIDFYISSSLLNSVTLRFYGRYNNSTNNGYMVEVYTTNFWFDIYTEINIYKIVNGTTYYLGGNYYENMVLFNSWHNLKIEFIDNRINVYLDGGIVDSPTDNQFNFGSIRIYASGLRTYTVYFDNICIEETQ
ncbi:MAG: hypothetical protein ACP5KX_05210 [Caldisericia bacterium]